MDYVLWFILSLPLLLSIMLSVFQARRNRRLKARMEDVAQGLNLSFPAEDEVQTLLQDLERFSVFQQGYYRKVENVRCGTIDGSEFFLLDVNYDDSRPLTRGNRRLVLMVFRSDQFRFPPFRMREDRFSDKLRATETKYDLTFEEYPTFSKKYHVTGSGSFETEVRQLFRSEVLDFFSQNQGWYVEGHTDILLICRRKRKLKPPDFKQLLVRAMEIKRLFVGAA